jgi:L-fuculose-phosphate aldolase
MSFQDEEKIRQDIVQAARLLHSREYISGFDGNISVRIGRNRLICTPSAVNKGFLEAKDLVVIDLEGNTLRGNQRSPSSEILMHLLVYAERPEIKAVVHAHPPHCVACTLTGINLSLPIVPETAYHIGAVPTAPYATPGTQEVPQSIRPFINESCAILLERHGSLTLGKDLWGAYNRLESLEHVARILYLSRNLGELIPLTPEQVARLRSAVTSRGLPWKFPDDGQLPPQLVDSIVKRVIEKLEDF